MKFFYQEYHLLLFCLVFSLFLSILIVSLSYMFAKQNPDTEKLSSYECGFDPYEDARNTFNVQFYLLAILFIVFDLETIFFFPWAVSLAFLTCWGFWTMIDFTIELAIGFLYVWKIGALEWK